MVDILKTIDDDIKLCEMYANYWIAMATTGVGTRRKLFHGTAGGELSDEEKIEDCLKTSMNHIHRMDELIDKKKSLIEKEEKLWQKYSKP